ncbi:MAG: hypothetical protein K9K37_08985 [Desulfocapsa sp.]|nr:hypothetical protein [Desulfocapsa sp.]
MIHSFRPLFFVTILLLGLSMTACSGKPTRHLVSDVCMIKSGQTSRQEVLQLMGEPDSKRMLGPDTEEWVYYEEARATMQDAPLVGGAFDPDGYNMVVVTLSGNTVTTCRYSGFEEDEFDWQDDYSWQEIEKK